MYLEINDVHDTAMIYVNQLKCFMLCMSSAETHNYAINTAEAIESQPSVSNILQ